MTPASTLARTGACRGDTSGVRASLAQWVCSSHWMAEHHSLPTEKGKPDKNRTAGPQQALPQRGARAGLPVRDEKAFTPPPASPGHTGLGQERDCLVLPVCPGTQAEGSPPLCYFLSEPHPPAVCDMRAWPCAWQALAWARG